MYNKNRPTPNPLLEAIHISSGENIVVRELPYQKYLDQSFLRFDGTETILPHNIPIYSANDIVITRIITDAIMERIQNKVSKESKYQNIINVIRKRFLIQESNNGIFEKWVTCTNDIKQACNITSVQASRWLQKLEDDGIIQCKTSKPNFYALSIMHGFEEIRDGFYIKIQQ